MKDTVQASIAAFVLKWTAKLLQNNGAHCMSVEWRPVAPGVYDLDAPPPPGIEITVTLLVEWRWDMYATASYPVTDPAVGVIEVCKRCLEDRPLDRSQIPFLEVWW